jgi:hypothetical protein
METTLKVGRDMDTVLRIRKKGYREKVLYFAQRLSFFLNSIS